MLTPTTTAPPPHPAGALPPCRLQPARDRGIPAGRPGPGFRPPSLAQRLLQRLRRPARVHSLHLCAIPEDVLPDVWHRKCARPCSLRMGASTGRAPPQRCGLWASAGHCVHATSVSQTKLHRGKAGNGLLSRASPINGALICSPLPACRASSVPVSLEPRRWSSSPARHKGEARTHSLGRRGICLEGGAQAGWHRQPRRGGVVVAGFGRPSAAVQGRVQAQLCAFPPPPLGLSTAARQAAPARPSSFVSPPLVPCHAVRYRAVVVNRPGQTCAARQSASIPHQTPQTRGNHSPNALCCRLRHAGAQRPVPGRRHRQARPRPQPLGMHCCMPGERSLQVGGVCTAMQP